eukprot:6632186-Pyramimonas_sp.AAC.1
MSKRSRVRAEALRTRRDRLPEHLREEFDGLHYPGTKPPEDDTPFFLPDSVWDTAACAAATHPKFQGDL